MEQKINKIFWRIGQEITPETFIHADNYICSQHNLIRKLITHENYGLLPQFEAESALLSVKANLVNKDIYIENLVCSGTTCAGYLIEIENRTLDLLPQKHLSIPASEAKTLYVVLRINPFEQILIEPVENEEAPLAHLAYELNIRELEHIREDELAIIKIDNSQHSPVIDPDYIPPCMSVNSCPKMLEVCESIKQHIAGIRSVIENKKDQFGRLMYPLSLLHCELDEFSQFAPPMALIRLIKKIIMTYQFFIPDIRMMVTTDSFGKYCQNDLAIYFKSLISCLQEAKEIIGKVEIIIEEDFTPRI